MEENYVDLPTTDEIENLITQNQKDKLRELLVDVHPADIADLMDQLPMESAVAVFNLLDVETASEVLDETGSLIRQELVEKVDEELLADLLDELPMDDAADFLEDLPAPFTDRLLELMEPEEAEDVRELLAYEEETAGRLMTTDVAVLRRQWTVADTFDFLRSLEEPETLQYLYVVDRNDRLIGVVPLRVLVLAQPEQTIEEIMTADIISVPVTADREELAELVARYDFFAIPVVQPDGRLLGVVTVDDVLDIVEEEMTEDIQRLGGSEPLTQPYFSLSPIQLVRKRLVWLLLLFAASFVTDAIVNGFHNLLLAVAALAIFMPVVSGTAGNAGSQTVTTIIRAMAVGELRFGDIWRALRRELVVGLIMGVLLGVFGYLRAVIFNVGPGVSLVLALTLPLVVIWATVVATVVPIMAEKLNIDPTVVSAPMITTIVDASGLLIYFGLAVWILNF
jgi:magnesium transporter